MAELALSGLLRPPGHIPAGRDDAVLAASFLVNHRRFGGSTAHQPPEPVRTLARRFSRPRCVFCGLNAFPGVARRMLLAGQIKSWKNSSASDPLDPRNSLTACPSHDVAFDTGMVTVSADLKIHIARPLAEAARGDHLIRQYYGRPPLLDTLLLPDDAERPRRKYLDWHREKVFVA